MNYQRTQVTCSCGNSFETRSSKSFIQTDICSECHPFYTGQRKLVDNRGRIDRFRRRQAKAASVN